MKPFLTTTFVLLLCLAIIATGMAMLLSPISVWWAVGAWTCFLTHYLRVRFYYQNEETTRDEYFIDLSNRKEFKLEYVAWGSLLLVNIILGKCLWSGFYGVCGFAISAMLCDTMELLMVRLWRRK